MRRQARIVRRRLERQIKCAVGLHRYVIDWNTPVGEQAGKCAWCGNLGPWRRTA